MCLCKRFPNGLESYLETHFHIAGVIAIELSKPEFDSKVVDDRYAAQGTGGMYELAQELTDEFEVEHEAATMADSNYFEIIDDFIERKLYSKTNE